MLLAAFQKFEAVPSCEFLASRLSSSVKGSVAIRNKATRTVRENLQRTTEIWWNHPRNTKNKANSSQTRLTLVSVLGPSWSSWLKSVTVKNYSRIQARGEIYQRHRHLKLPLHQKLHLVPQEHHNLFCWLFDLHRAHTIDIDDNKNTRLCFKISQVFWRFTCIT